MDTYKVNYRKARLNTTSYLKFPLKKEEPRSFSSTGQAASMDYIHSNSGVALKNGTDITDSMRICLDYHGCFVLEKDVPAVLRSINKSMLSAIVRKAMKRDNFMIQGWRARNLGGRVGNPANLGLYRFEGVGSDRNEWLDWSVILKVIQSPANLGYIDEEEAQDSTRWNYWKRELLIYQSGWLESLPEGIAAPHCYDAVEMPGNIAGIWLEDVKDSYSGTWPLHRYALAARHLGRLNGIYISRRPLPNIPWLGRHRTRQLLNTLPWQTFPWDHPTVWQHFPDPELDSFRSLLYDNKRFLAKLEQLPKTVSIGETDPSNIISRRMPRNLDQSVVLNWSLAGIEVLGADLGQLVYGTWKTLRGYKMHDISETMFTSYVNGLQDSGCRVDTQLVRFGYITTAAFRLGLARMLSINEQLKHGEDYSAHITNHGLTPKPYESIMADEAYRLLDSI